MEAGRIGGGNQGSREQVWERAGLPMVAITRVVTGPKGKSETAPQREKSWLSVGLPLVGGYRSW